MIYKVEMRIIPAVAIFLLIPAALSQTPKDPVEKIRQAVKLNTLDTPGMQPWHLRFDFQTHDFASEKGAKGTLEEWWTPDGYRLVISSDRYNATEVRNTEGLFRTPQTNPVPYAIGVLQSNIVHPFFGLDLDHAKFDVHREDFAKITFECYSLLGELKGGPSFDRRYLFPKYCFLPSEDGLRLTVQQRGQTLPRSTIGVFRDHRVAVDLGFVLPYEVNAQAHVTALNGIPVAEAKLQDVTGLVKSDPAPAIMNEGLLRSRLLYRPDPEYPMAAKTAHIGGTVIVLATIGKDGLVKKVDLVNSRNESLTVASINAVKGWKFKPILVDGEAVEVHFLIQVNFTFGSE